MPIQLNGSAGIGTPAITSGEYNSGQLAGFRNKILNGRFNINQAGAVSRTATTNAYNFGQWYYDGTYLYQPIPTEDVYDGTYTLSWEGNSTAAWSLNATGSFGQGSETYTPVAKGGQIVVSGHTNEHLWVRFATDLANLNKVQLEPGSVATPFEDRFTSQELALCQRYFEKSYNQDVAPGTMTAVGMSYHIGASDGAANSGPDIRFKVTKRTAPTFTAYRSTTGDVGVWDISNAGGTTTASPNASLLGVNGGLVYFSGFGTNWAAAACSGHWTASARI